MKNQESITAFLASSIGGNAEGENVSSNGNFRTYPIRDEVTDALLMEARRQLVKVAIDRAVESRMSNGMSSSEIIENTPHIINNSEAIGNNSSLNKSLAGLKEKIGFNNTSSIIGKSARIMKEKIVRITLRTIAACVILQNLVLVGGMDTSSWKGVITRHRVINEQVRKMMSMAPSCGLWNTWKAEGESNLGINNDPIYARLSVKRTEQFLQAFLKFKLEWSKQEVLEYKQLRLASTDVSNWFENEDLEFYKKIEENELILAKGEPKMVSAASSFSEMFDRTDGADMILSDSISDEVNKSSDEVNKSSDEVNKSSTPNSSSLFENVSITTNNDDADVRRTVESNETVESNKATRFYGLASVLAADGGMQTPEEGEIATKEELEAKIADEANANNSFLSETAASVLSESFVAESIVSKLGLPMISDRSISADGANNAVKNTQQTDYPSSDYLSSKDTSDFKSSALETDGIPGKRSGAVIEDSNASNTSGNDEIKNRMSVGSKETSSSIWGKEDETDKKNLRGQKNKSKSYIPISFVEKTKMTEKCGSDDEFTEEEFKEYREDLSFYPSNKKLGFGPLTDLPPDMAPSKPEELAKYQLFYAINPLKRGSEYRRDLLNYCRWQNQDPILRDRDYAEKMFVIHRARHELFIPLFVHPMENAGGSSSTGAKQAVTLKVSLSSTDGTDGNGWRFEGNLSEYNITSHHNAQSGKNRKIIIIICTVLSFILIVAGIVFYILLRKKKDQNEDSDDDDAFLFLNQELENPTSDNAQLPTGEGIEGVEEMDAKQKIMSEGIEAMSVQELQNLVANIAQESGLQVQLVHTGENSGGAGPATTSLATTNLAKGENTETMSPPPKARVSGERPPVLPSGLESGTSSGSGTSDE